MTGGVKTGRCDSSILGGRLLASTPRVARTRIHLSVGRKKVQGKNWTSVHQAARLLVGPARFGNRAGSVKEALCANCTLQPFQC